MGWASDNSATDLAIGGIQGADSGSGIVNTAAPPDAASPSIALPGIAAPRLLSTTRRPPLRTFHTFESLTAVARGRQPPPSRALQSPGEPPPEQVRKLYIKLGDWAAMDPSRFDDSEICMPPLPSAASRIVSRVNRGAQRVSMVGIDGRVMRMESALEGRVAAVLMARRDIVSLREQPPPVRYRDYAGEWHQHYFDFLATTEDGDRYAVAVKPRKYADEEFLGVREAVGRYTPPTYSREILIVMDDMVPPTEATDAHLLWSVRTDTDIPAYVELCRFLPSLRGATTIADLAGVLGRAGGVPRGRAPPHRGVPDPGGRRASLTHDPRASSRARLVPGSQGGIPHMSDRNPDGTMNTNYTMQIARRGASDPVPTYAYKPGDRLVIDGMDYRYECAVAGGHKLLRASTTDFVEYVSHNDLHAYDVANALSHDAGLYTQAGVEVRARTLEIPFSVLPPWRQARFGFKLAVVVAFRAGYADGRFKRTEDGIKAALPVIREELLRIEGGLHGLDLERLDALEAEEDRLASEMRNLGCRKGLRRFDSEARRTSRSRGEPPTLSNGGLRMPRWRSVFKWVREFEQAHLDPTSLRDGFDHCGGHTTLPYDMVGLLETALEHYSTEMRPSGKFSYEYFREWLRKAGLWDGS